jgi:hypothetical protein
MRECNGKFSEVLQLIDVKQKIWRGSSKCNWKSLKQLLGRVNNKLWLRAKCSVTCTEFLVKSDFFSAFHRRVLHWPARIHITRSEIAPLICINHVNFPRFSIIAIRTRIYSSMGHWKGRKEPPAAAGNLSLNQRRMHARRFSNSDHASLISMCAFVQPTACLTVKTKQ